MAQRTIQDWTESQVSLELDEHREVQYRVYRDGDSVFQEVRAQDEEPILTFELPEGLKLDKNSYEVLLRYALLDLAAA